jgi:hypothetical protein
LPEEVSAMIAEAVAGKIDFEVVNNNVDVENLFKLLSNKERFTLIHLLGDNS